MTEADSQKSWVKLNPAPWWLPVLGGTPTPFLFLLFVPLMAINVTTLFDLSPIWAVLVALFILVALVPVTLLLVRAVYPPAWLNPATGMLRAGRKQVRFAEITDARLAVLGGKKHRSLQLVLRAGRHKLRASVLVRDARRNTLDAEAAALVQEMLRQSNIAMPTSPDDPKGTFARYNFPANLTKDEAVELMAHPPASADRLPLPYL